MADTNPPEGSITISDMTWNKWLNQITFGKFFNKTQKVEITAHDTGTGIANIVCYVAEGEQSVEQLNALPNGKWNLYEKEFTVEPDGRMVVYAKITDKAGNTAMANVQVYVQKVTQPPVFIGISDGGSYCENVKFTVEDDNLEKVFAGDTQLTADNGIYTIQGSNQPVKVTAVDADGNRVEVTIQKKEDVSEAQQAQAEAQPEQTQSAPVQIGDSTPVTWLFALLALSGTGIVGSKAKKSPAGTVSDKI